MSGACAPGVSVHIHPRSRRLTCFNGDAVAPDAFECGSACQPETAYARSRTPLTNANEPHRPPPAPGHASGDPRPRVGRFRLACRTTFERISGDSVAVEARNATAPVAYLRGNSWRTRPARFPPSPQSPSVPGAPLTRDRKSFQRILPRRVALGARHAPASGSYLTASMRRSLCAPQVELRPTRRGTSRWDIWPIGGVFPIHGGERTLLTRNRKPVMSPADSPGSAHPRGQPLARQGGRKREV